MDENKELETMNEVNGENTDMVSEPVNRFVDDVTEKKSGVGKWLALGVGLVAAGVAGVVTYVKTKDARDAKRLSKRGYTVIGPRTDEDSVEEACDDCEVADEDEFEEKN